MKLKDAYKVKKTFEKFGLHPSLKRVLEWFDSGDIVRKI